MRLSELAFELAVGMVPALDTPRNEAWCRALGEGLSARRFGAVALTALLLVQPQPAQAQWTDFTAYAQRATQYLKDEYNTLKTFIHDYKTEYNWELDWLRSGLMAYKSYQQGQAMYRRLSGPMNIALGQSLPTLEIETSTGGSTEKIIVSPIFSARHRDPSFSGPKFSVSIWGTNPKNFINLLKSGDVDIDRFVIDDPDPDAGKSAGQIQAEAVNDATQSWRDLQRNAGVNPTNHNLPNSPGYLTYEQAYTKAYAKRTADLQRNAQRALSHFGEDSSEYRRQLSIYSDWALQLGRGLAKADSDKDISEMRDLDIEAHRSMENYAVAVATMRLANQRRNTAKNNKKDNAKLHRATAEDPISSLDKWLGFTAFATTLTAIGNPYKKDAVDRPSREVVANAVQQNIDGEIVNGELKDMNQAEARKTASAEQDKLNELARRKRAIEARQAAKAKLMAGADGVEAQRLDTKIQSMALEASFLNAILPEGQVLVLPRHLAVLVPGTEPTENSDRVVRAAFGAASQKAVDSVTAEVERTFSGPPIGWGFFTSWVKAFGAGFRSFTGKPFDLTRMGVK